MNLYLVTGAVLSALAAFAHIGIIIFGAPWYRFFGAGEKLATMAEQGSKVPAIVTAGIASVLFGFSAFALSGASLIPLLPFLKPVLIAITAVYLLRGIAGFWWVYKPSADHSRAFGFWSSSICLAFGLVHLAGVLSIL